ncbi:protein-L-isoaspartate O-methyltransferase family protein [Chitinimonas lacunae]|uniref:Protein-L-isoaspartate O-methyltransferase n=1 Tax=Chitinimonas lacunae TaxID=1963018 RepID=A0ABV8MT65_9NEIS
MDWENARFNMVEQQIRPWDVLDQTVLNLLFHVKREQFVPEAHRQMAFVDMELPLGNGFRMWQPKLEARVLQELGLKRTDRVLEIGTGSGYLTALLSHLVKHVYSVEIDPATADAAREQLKAAGCLNVTVETGDAALGWDRHAPYDVIVAGGSYPTRPEALLGQLAEGGRLWAVVGELPVMSASLFTKVGGAVKEEKLFETVLEPLRNVPPAPKFQF